MHKFLFAFIADETQTSGIAVIFDNNPRIDDFEEDTQDPIAVDLSPSKDFIQALLAIVRDPGVDGRLYLLLSTVAQAGYEAGFARGMKEGGDTFV